MGQGMVRVDGWSSPLFLVMSGNLDPVNYWSEINLGSGIDNGALQATPCLGRHEFALHEDPHIGGRKVYVFFLRVWRTRPHFPPRTSPVRSSWG